MARKSYELYYALAAVIAVTALYWLVVARVGTPASSGLLGHGIGVLGFLMMLATETLYSIRKRSRRRLPGRMSTWLRVHIFMGIVGPYLVLLHTAWRFQGLAGLTMLLTVTVVISGFIGRYIYTAVPRTVGGAEVGLQELEAQIAQADERLAAVGVAAPAFEDGATPQLASLGPSSRPRSSQKSTNPGRSQLMASRNYRRQARAYVASLGPAGAADARELTELLDRRYRLENQVRSLATARRLLALWHTVHIPLGITLFSLAFIHAGAALYYATLLH